MTKFWPVERSYLDKYRQFKKNHNLSSSEIEAYMKEIKKLQNIELPVIKGVAVIDVFGLLTNRKSFYTFLFSSGSTTYPEIIEKLDMAAADSDVEKVQMRVNSPGGYLDGLFDVLYRMKAFSKPIEAVIGDRADSAAYGIVSQADKIIAANEMSEVGSVGIGVSFYVSSNVVDVTSSDAPDKWPDPKTEPGVAVIRAELDEIHAKFAGIIAEGRAAATGKAISLETVNANFGRGATMLADAGLAAGMIDEIIPAPERVSNADFFSGNNSAVSFNFADNSQNQKPDKVSGKSSNKKSKKVMDIKELKKDHTEVYDEALQVGAERERNRIDALLVMGKASGKIDFALECIKEGKSVKDDVVFATFKTAEINKEGVDDREKENAEDVTEPEADDKKTDEEAEVKKYLDRRKQKNPSAYKSA